MSQTLQGVTSVAKQIDENVRLFLALAQNLEAEGKAKEENVKKYQQQVIQLQKSESKYLERIKNLVDENTSLRMQMGKRDDLISKYQGEIEVMRSKWRSILSQYRSIKDQMKTVKNSISKSKTRLLSIGEVAEIERNCDELEKAAQDASQQVQTSEVERTRPNELESAAEQAGGGIQVQKTSLSASPASSQCLDKSATSALNNSAKKKKSLRLRRSLDFEEKKSAPRSDPPAADTPWNASSRNGQIDNVGTSLRAIETLKSKGRQEEIQIISDVVVAETPPECDYNPSQNSPILIRRNEKSKFPEFYDDMDGDAASMNIVTADDAVEPKESSSQHDKELHCSREVGETESPIQVCEQEESQWVTVAQKAASPTPQEKKRKHSNVEDPTDGQENLAGLGGLGDRSRGCERRDCKNSSHGQHAGWEESRNEGSTSVKPAVLVNYVTRKKADRAELKGFTCDCCDNFFEKVFDNPSVLHAVTAI
eukprot:762552-Hanusia_phi.AAC.1